MIKLRYHTDELQRLQPLNVNDAKKLQLTSERMQNQREITTVRRKWRSVHESLDKLSLSPDKQEDYKNHTVVLEELVRNDQFDADGSRHGVSAEKNRNILRRSFTASDPIPIAASKNQTSEHDYGAKIDYGYDRDDKSYKK